MSFLDPNLFIPHKDMVENIGAIVGSCDPAVGHESNARMRTNWLALQRWANQGLWSAAMAQSTAQPVGASNSGVPEILTNFTSLWTAKTSAVDTTNSRFVLPATGIYQATVNLTLLWNSTTGFSTNNFQDDALGAVLVSSSAATPPLAVTFTQGLAASQLQVISTFKCTATPCYVQAGATVSTPSTNPPTNGTANAYIFSVVRIGSIPSAVQ